MGGGGGIVSFRRRPHFLKNLSTREANSCLLKLSPFEKYPDVSIHLKGNGYTYWGVNSIKMFLTLSEKNLPEGANSFPTE